MLNHKKILITTGGGIGDMIMFTPSLYELKKMFPFMELSVLTRHETASILEGLAWIDNVIAVKRGIPFSRFRAFPDIMKQDYIIFTDWQPQGLLWSYLCRVPHRIGKARWGHTLNHCLNQYILHDVMLSDDYAAETNRRIFSEALGVDIQGDMTTTHVSMPRMEDYLSLWCKLEQLGIPKGSSYIVLSPYSSKYERDWTEKEIVDFMQRVEKTYQLPVVICGVTKEHNRLIEQCSYNLLNKTSILELIALIQQAKLLIAVDSGPMHIASATKTPVVALFNKDKPSRWAPKRNCTYINWSDEALRSMYLEKGFKIVCADDITHISNITSELVYDSVQYMLSETVIY